MIKFIVRVFWLAVVGTGLFLGYRWTESRVAVDVYKQRLENLSGEYETLRTRYNHAVRKTAVTELIVKDRKLSLVIRTVDGIERTINTPFDPAREIYCDYVLLDGRLWIRRLYDSITPPDHGLLIDDTLADVDWTDPAARYGNAVYRALDEGRWVVTVTGDGSLGLAKAEPADIVDLQHAPPVRDYEELQEQIDSQVDAIGPADVFKYWIGEE